MNRKRIDDGLQKRLSISFDKARTRQRAALTARDQRTPIEPVQMASEQSKAKHSHPALRRKSALRASPAKLSSVSDRRDSIDLDMAMRTPSERAHMLDQDRGY